MLGYDSYGRDELEAMLDKERDNVRALKKQIEDMQAKESKKVNALKKKIEDMKADEYVRSVDDGMEIHRLHRCVIKMTRQWLSAIDDMYSRLDDVHGLDDQDVLDWDKVSNLHKKLDKVFGKVEVICSKKTF